MLTLIALLMFLSDDPTGQSKAALARELDVSEESIRVESVRAVNWPDTSLGCPQKGKSYEAQKTPGHLVVLRVERKRYEVHLGAGQVVVCDSLKTTLPSKKTPSTRDPQPADPSPAIPMPEDVGLRSLVQQAKQDLAQRLSVNADGILLVELKEVVWPDSSLGCPQPGMAYLQVPSDGLLIRLRVEEKSYRYHRGGMKPLFLCDPPSQ